MTDILRIGEVSITNIFVGVCVIIVGFNALAKIIGDFSKTIGKPVKWVKSSSKIEDIEKQYNTIRTDLESLKEMVVDDRIDRMRYEILDMASAISENNRWYSVEQLRHALRVYDVYEKFLEENNRQNGEVEISIKIIKKAYQDKYRGMGDEEDTE